MAKVAFIIPKQRFNPYGFFNIYPLGPLYLATILKERGHEAIVYDENREIIYDEKKKILKPEILENDFVGVSLIAPSARRGMEILQSIKKQKPSIKTMAGGPHATLMPEECREYTDIVVKGEAEEVIVDVIGGLEGIIQGIPANLDNLPIPEYSLLHKNKRNLGNIILGKTASISTSRGCPRVCEFCTVRDIFGKKVRIVSVEKEAEERKIRHKQGFKNIFYHDDNFSIHPKREGHLEMMIKQREKGIKLSATIQDEVSIIRKGGGYTEKMKKAGVNSVLLGVESLNEDSLRAYKKPHSSEETVACIKKLQEKKINVHAFCIFGLDSDSIEDIKNMAKFFRKLGVKTAQFAILTPFPGSKLYEEMEERITTRNFNLYDALSVVFEPLKMNAKTLWEYTIKNWREFYSLRNIIKSLSKLDFYEFVRDMCGYFLTNKIVKLCPGVVS